MFLIGVLYSTCLFVGPLLVVYIIPYVESEEVDYLYVMNIMAVLIASKIVSSLS